MTDCCNTLVETNHKQYTCPVCSSSGKSIEIITLKSLLLPNALIKLNPQSNYRMCLEKTCSIVYFNEMKEVFSTEDIKVPVYQKTDDDDCPVCYCFGWTRKQLKKVEQNKKKH